MQYHGGSSTKYLYNSYHFLIYFSYILFYISHIFLIYILIYFSHISPFQYAHICNTCHNKGSHLQWLLVVLIVSSLSTGSGFSTVSGFSSHPPISFLYFTSFSQDSIQTRWKHIYISYSYSIFIFIFVFIFIFIFPCIPYTIHPTTCHLHNSLEHTGIFINLWTHW